MNAIVHYASTLLCGRFPCSALRHFQNVVVAPSGTLDLVNADGSGKCSVIFVGITPTAAQKIELQDYARLFKASMA